MAGNKKPMVSVIIATYNRAQWLKKSIQSILNQTYQDFELIVVDDHSTDETPQVVKSFKDQRIKYFQQTKTFPIKSQGAAAARNIGLKKAKGDLIAFNDDDDLWKKQKLAKQVKALAKADKKTGVVYTRIRRISDKEKKLIPTEKEVVREGDVHRDLFLENWIVALPAALVKKECFQKAGLFDEDFPRYQDWELWLRISQDYHFQYLPQVLVDSYMLGQGIRSDDRALLKATELIFQKHQKEIKQDQAIFASWCFRLGDLYYHRQEMKKAREFFKKAYQAQPKFRYFRAIVKTFLGKRLSEALISCKVKLMTHKKLLAIFGLALVLRLINLNQSLWLDEAVRAIMARGSFFNIFQELGGDFHPPFYHLFIWVWVHLLGDREIILRLPSVLFGVATVFGVYLIGQEIFAKKNSYLAEIAALLMATAPFHLYYSQEARNYALATLLATFSIYFFLRINREAKKPLIFGYLATTVLLLYTNYFGLFVLLAQALVIAWQRQWRRGWLIFTCLVLFSPDWVLLKTQLLTGRQAVTSLPEWGRLVNLSFFKALPLTLAKFSLGRITIFNKKLYTIIIGVLFIFYGLLLGRGLMSKKRPLVLFAWLIVPISLAWLISFFIPNYQPFRLLLVLPAFYLLLVYGASFFPKRFIFVIILIILGINLVSAFVYFSQPYFYREDWQGVVRFIENQPGTEKIALLPSYTSHWPYDYYSLNKTPLVSLSSGFQMVEKENLEEKLEPYSSATVYYIRYLVPMFDSQERINTWLKENGFVKIKEVSFNQIPVWIYKPK
ncbi:MAG TPA: glycosyltransferase [Patescibacteria group bacterium]|nr:glycosyltransferase [Patescibacteria group bacterium]